MISLIFPMYNEEDVLLLYPEEVLATVDRFRALYRENFEIVMVDDGSADHTYERMQQMASERAGIIVVRHSQNRGMGAALKTGVQASHGDLIVFMDADLTFRPEDIRILLDAYRAEPADCISGSPYMSRDLTGEVQPARLLLSRGVNILYRLMLGWKITSVSPVFRLYRRAALDRLNIKSENFEINAEILSKMIFAGMSIREVPVALHARTHGHSKINVKRSIRMHMRLLSKIFMTKYITHEWS